ncbi:uncharacterized protein METZ01_LOCUS116586 [marine metagenome]|uniref:Uncharacterized protein n=1 Tax=marine metagenome TaxID=408172 RepID=A0A381XGR2_9ZZZZ
MIINGLEIQKYGYIDKGIGTIYEKLILYRIGSALR